MSNPYSMQSLRSSSDLIENGAAMRSRLAEDGYLYFPRFFDAKRIAQLRRDILRAIARYGWIRQGTDPFDAIPSQPVRFHLMEGGRLLENSAGVQDHVTYYKQVREAANNYEGAGWRDGYIAIQRLESLHRQAYEPRLLSLMQTLFDDEDILVHGQRVPRIVWPGGKATEPHQDYPHIQGTADTITAWLPLSDCSRELGGLRYLVGAHRKGAVLSHGADARRPGWADVSNDDPDWATADWKLGDLALHHSLTVHGALPNTSGRLRLSVDYRYQAAKEPVATPSLKPTNCPYVPDWPELLDGVNWNSFEWVDHARQIDRYIVTNLVPAFPIETWHERVPVPRSRLLTLS